MKNAEEIMNNFSVSDFDERPQTENGIEITREFADKQIKEYAEFLDNELIR